MTPRRLEVLRLTAAGYTEEEIGVRLGISRGTVKQHLSDVRALLNAANSTHAVVVALQEGILDLASVPRRRVAAG